MNREDLRQLLDYHYWARDRVLDAVGALPAEQYTREVGGSFPSIRQTLVHTYAAEWVWHSRWHGHSPRSLAEAEDFADATALRAAWAALEPKMRRLVDDAADADLSRSFDYTLLSGVRGTSTLAQVVQHFVNHATYHRGQVTTQLRLVGAAPPRSTDLIAYFREHQAAAR